MALNGSLNKIKKSLGLEPNLFFAVYELVIYFEKCATGSNFCGAFEAISHFLGAPVVHSAEWTTGSIFQAQITHYIIYDIMGFLHHVKFLVQALGDMLEQLALTLLQWLVAQLNCGH